MLLGLLSTLISAIMAKWSLNKARNEEIKPKVNFQLELKIKEYFRSFVDDSITVCFAFTVFRPSFTSLLQFWHLKRRIY